MKILYTEELHTGLERHKENGMIKTTTFSCCLEGTVPLIHNVCDGQSNTTVFHEHKR